jgi:hypothetical protein
MILILDKLNPEDIQQKIDFNNRDGIDIYKLRDLITEEYKDFKWMAIRAEVQCQFYVEQLAYIEKKIKEMESVTA